MRKEVKEISFENKNLIIKDINNSVIKINTSDDKERNQFMNLANKELLKLVKRHLENLPSRPHELDFFLYELNNNLPKKGIRLKFNIEFAIIFAIIIGIMIPVVNNFHLPSLDMDDATEDYTEEVVSDEPEVIEETTPDSTEVAEEEELSWEETE